MSVMDATTEKDGNMMIETMKSIYKLMLLTVAVVAMSLTSSVSHADEKVTPLYEMSVADIDATQDIAEMSDVQKINVMAGITFNISTAMANKICTDWSPPNPQTGISTRQCATAIVGTWTEYRGGGEV